MNPRASMRAMLSLTACLLALVSVAPGRALADAQVRFLHAVPGGPPAQLQISGERQVTLEAVVFGEATEYSNAPARRVGLALVAGGKRLARASATFAEGARYTVLASRTSRLGLRVLRDSRAAPARARLRVVNAAPELGSAE